jgi:hypothetical protein
MFQVRELSIKLTGSDEARGPLLACVVCDSTAEGTCPTPSAIPLFACNVCDSTPESDCPTLSMAVQALGNELDGLQLLREQLNHHLAQLN